METSQIVDHLNDLLQLEYDAVHAYTSAINHVDDRDLLDHLTSFRADHNHHVNELVHLVKIYGGTPKAKPDLKGPFLKGLTGVMSSTGSRNALRIMLQNENLTNKAYDGAVDDDYPAEIHQLMEQFLADERRHRAWIQQELDSWGEPAAAPEEERPEAP